jgi:hypothetical protein
MRLGEEQAQQGNADAAAAVAIDRCVLVCRMCSLISMCLQ